jgi:hypothetical protein
MYDKSDKDDFWSVDKLIPSKMKTISPFSTKEKTVAHAIPGNKGLKGDNKLSFDSYKPSDGIGVSECSYHPENGALIKKVEIKPSYDKYDFFDTFRKAALIYYDYKCDKCNFEPFYSYKPQYSQMTPEQKQYYFYWRYSLRSGKFLRTDYSYVYLYAYEILNLPDKISPELGLDLLVTVWTKYREDLPKLDLSFSAWIRDYCLLYRLPCPYDKIKDFIFEVINATDLKEFYISGLDLHSNGSVSCLLAYLSDYDWRRGKYSGGEHGKNYKRHLEGAMGLVLSRAMEEFDLVKGEPVVVQRSIFPGCLCTHSVKCNLAITYFPLSEAYDLRRGITAAIKYTENKLRALLGVKSRIAVKELPDKYQWMIDRYFDSLFEKAKKERAKA